MMELSKRLRAIADLVSEGGTVADVGTDHGYVPIWLLKTGKNPSAIATDINEGPLKRAKEHITGEGLADYIETRRSDGLTALCPGEADTIVIAGMGGGLTIRILEMGEVVLKHTKECILQPQSEIENVRSYLNRKGYTIEAEDMVLEDGKFYPVMKVIHGTEAPYSIPELRYGRQLLKMGHPVLLKYLEKEITVKENIIKRLGEIPRKEELKKEAECAKEALCLVKRRNEDAVWRNHKDHRTDLSEKRRS